MAQELGMKKGQYLDLLWATRRGCLLDLMKEIMLGVYLVISKAKRRVMMLDSLSVHVYGSSRSTCCK